MIVRNFNVSYLFVQMLLGKTRIWMESLLLNKRKKKIELIRRYNVSMNEAMYASKITFLLVAIIQTCVLSSVIDEVFTSCEWFHTVWAYIWSDKNNSSHILTV